MIILGALKGNELCCVNFSSEELQDDYAYFNYVCGGIDNVVYILFWIIPVCGLAVVTLFYVIKITIFKRGVTPSLLLSTNDKDVMLALIVYNIPIWSFLGYLADLIITTTGNNSKSLIVAILQNLPFTMTLVNAVTVRKYMKYNRKESLIQSRAEI